MTNNEKIQKAEQLIAEANALLNEVKADSNEEDVIAEDVIAKYKNDYCSIRYFLDSFSNIDMFGGIDWKNRGHYSFNETPNPYQYYLTEELAEQAKKLKDFNDKLLAFKYCYDLDYKPDWNDHIGNKFFVCYKHTDGEKGEYMVDYHYVTQTESIVYFSTEAIAQKCADWLNNNF